VLQGYWENLWSRESLACHAIVDAVHWAMLNGPPAESSASLAEPGFLTGTNFTIWIQHADEDVNALIRPQGLAVPW
jgi:hypothetical protein